MNSLVEMIEHVFGVDAVSMRTLNYRSTDRLTLNTEQESRVLLTNCFGVPVILTVEEKMCLEMSSSH